MRLLACTFVDDGPCNGHLRVRRNEARYPKSEEKRNKLYGASSSDERGVLQ